MPGHDQITSGGPGVEAFVRILHRWTKVERPQSYLAAALLGKPEGTIKADLFGARRKLKTVLEERDG